MDRALMDALRNTSNQVLTATSGNAQPHIDHGHNQKKQTADEVSGYQYPVPTNTLGSNDHWVLVKRKINSRKLKHRMALAQQCWQHPKYLKYYTRGRKDTDKVTGEVIWADDVEKAFHNAIVNLPPIGKKKKAQHGRPHGHNELIGEWILQETGKVRARKQISSHVQVLGKMFKNVVPEWAILTRQSDDIGADPDEGNEYYHNSIEDMVRDWKMSQGDGPGVDTTHSNLPYSTYSLARLDFEMWVSLPDNMEQPLHRYTRIQSNQPTSVPEPLENVSDWRIRWPHLVPIMENLSSREQPEIALIDSTFELMKDFPPRKSKLGINLALSFTNPLSADHTSDGDCQWSCVSYFYHRGRLESETTHEVCQSVAPGKVRLPFESKWWAQKFTQLTEKRRRAQDSKNDAAIAAAEESVRSHLRNLTVMQRISARPRTSQVTTGVWNDQAATKPRLTILLWTFSQASETFVGTATWRRLVSPPARMAVNSPPPVSLEMALPPLDMDYTVNTTIHDNLFSFNHSLPPQVLEDEVRHDSATPTWLLEQQRKMQRSYVYPNTMPSNPQGTFDNHFNAQYPPEYPSHVSEHEEQLFSIPNNFFETQEHRSYTQMSHSRSYNDHDDVTLEAREDSEVHHLRRPLMTFDMNTHDLLQEQLSSDHHYQHSRLDHEQSQHIPTYEQIAGQDSFDPNHSDQKLSKALAVQQCLEDGQALRPQTANIGPDTQPNIRMLPSNASPPIIAPVAVRPVLQQHHSFAGIGQHDESVADDAVENDSRSTFVISLENYGLDRDDASGLGNGLVMPDTFNRLGATRAHSQPPSSGTTGQESISGEVIPESELMMTELV